MRQQATQCEEKILRDPHDDAERANQLGSHIAAGACLNANLFAPVAHFSLDLVTYAAHSFQARAGTSLKRSRIIEWPREANDRTWEDWARTRRGFGLAANCNDVRENWAGPPHIKDPLCCILRNVDSYLAHNLNRQWINGAAFQTSAVRIETASTKLFQECRGHLTASAIPDTDEKDVGLLHACCG